MWGWTKLGTHSHSSTSFFETTTVVKKYGFSVLPLSLQLAIYSCPHRTVDFLSQWQQLERRCQLTAQKKSWTTCLSASQCCICHSENLLHRSTLWFMAAVVSFFLCHHTCVCTCLNHKLWTTWADFCICPHAIKLCLPYVYPWCHTRDQMYQALPLLSRESLEARLSFVHRATKQASWCNQRNARG